ncbi:glycosyltransferase family 2 protein [Winogradskyella wichelsiae]|uniref:glycosyltransferase family 2 protein n=1 Tax=Winogradskyella wichelsiae TaxID=2697007 RepID=UPI0015CA1CF4|nr:glycosyltransferase family 2 protein [Winogradskyella wichelsiae]
MTDPLVSIIIPTFNRAHLIGETLDSVLAQTYQNWEGIVVDDGSTDHTAELMQAYCSKDSRFQYHHRPADRLPGGNAARNYGFEMCKGEYLVFLDSDDILRLNCINNRLIYLGENDDVDFLVFQSQLFVNNIENSKIIPNILIKNTGDLKRFISYDYPWNISATLLKKKFLINKKIHWNESLSIHQDLEFYIQVLSVKPKYKKIENIPDVYIRMGNDDKISSGKIKKGILLSKYIFFESLIDILKREKLYDNDIGLRVYGLSLITCKLFLKNKSTNFLFKTLNIYLKQCDFRFSFFILFDVYYLFLIEKISSFKLKKMLKLYEFVFGGNRFKYLPPNGSTLGKITLENYLYSLK